MNGTASFFANGVNYQPGLMDYSPGNVTGPIVVVNNLGCEASNYPAEVEGNIALISRGTCEFGLKSILAGLAGAAGAVIYNNIPGALNGTLGLPREEGPYIPTIAISQENGTALVDTITSAMAVTGVVDVFAIIENRTTYNVLATTNCGSPNTTPALGAHPDSVAACPGINEDGSGSIGILEVAKQLSNLPDSTYYVESLSASELFNIRAYLNFDMIASPNYIYTIYDGDGSAFNMTGPWGSTEIEHFFEDWFADNGLNSTATAFDGRSDYQAFIANGIPAGGTFTGAEEIKTEEEAAVFAGETGVATDINYHQAGDTVSNLNMTTFEVNTKRRPRWPFDCEIIPYRLRLINRKVDSIVMGSATHNPVSFWIGMCKAFKCFGVLK